VKRGWSGEADPCGSVGRGRWSALGRLSVAVAVTAVLLSAAVTPAVLTLGAGVELAQERLDALEELPELAVAQRSTLLAADGSWLATFYAQNRTVIDIDTIPEVAIDAVLAVEDTRFYDHRGVDARGTARAFVSNLRTGAASQGGSTITQQYIKNRLAAAAPNPERAAEATVKTMSRKLREARYALEYERTHTKDEILSDYLNLAYFGSGAWGIEAAAQTYFAVPASQLTLPQAAVLAGQLQSPSRTDPAVHPDAALARRNTVLSQMVKTKRLDRSDSVIAAATPLGLSFTATANGCPASPYPYFCDWVVTELESDPTLGNTPEARTARLYQGGLVVTTTLDPKVQHAAQTAVDRLERTDRVTAVAVTVQPGTGNVQAMAVNRDYGTAANQSVVPFATTPSHPAGSTFKAFTVLAALEAGMRIDATVPGGDSWASKVFDNPASGSYTNAEPGGRRNVSLLDATTHSQNTAFVQIEERVGVQAVADAARRAGITNLPGRGAAAVSDREGSFTLGARSVSVLDLANSYATLAAHGLRCDASGVSSVSGDGAATTTRTPACEQTIDAAVADTATAVLATVVTSGTGRAASLGYRPVAGKTGTSGDYGSAWFAGYTPQYATAVMLGDPNGPANPLVNVDGVARVYGGTIPAEMFAVLMAQAHDGLDIVALAAVNPGHLIATKPAVANTSVLGLAYDTAAAKLAAAGVTVTKTVAAANGVPAGVVTAQRVTDTGMELTVSG
jgi:membrane peptidoglycan carboxypeptidase